MLEHKTQAAFLRALVGYEDGDASLQLRASLGKADRELKCLRRTMFLLLILLMLSLAGLGYCAILLPQIFTNPTHPVIQSLGIVGLASLIAQVEIMVYLLWRRGAVDRLHRECRRRILLLVESQIRTTAHPSRNPDPEPSSGSVQMTSASANCSVPKGQV